MNETNKKIKYTYNLFNCQTYFILYSDMLVHTQLKHIKVTQTFTLSEHSEVKRVDQIKVGRVGNLNFTYIVCLVNRNYSAILATLQITSYVHSRNSS